MKRFANSMSPDTDVGSEKSDLDVWQSLTPKEPPQTTRNTARIDQLEAGQEDIIKKLGQLEQIIHDLKSTKWVTKSHLFTVPFSWEEDAKGIEFDEDVNLWVQAQFATQTRGPAINHIVPPYQEKISTVTKLFGELEEDFDDIARRITRCAVLEEELGSFEDSLENEETESLASCISLIRDVLDYNYAEDLTHTHLALLKKAIELVCKKGVQCTKEDYQNLHKEFLQSALALLPTSRKAIEKYEPSKVQYGQ